MIKVWGNLGKFMSKRLFIAAVGDSIRETEVSIYSEIHGKLRGFSEEWILIPIDDSSWSHGVHNRVCHGEREES